MNEEQPINIINHEVRSGNKERERGANESLSSKQLGEQIMCASEEVVGNFTNACQQDIAEVESRAQLGGLVLADEDIKELKELSREAAGSREELVREIKTTEEESIGNLPKEVSDFLLKGGEQFFQDNDDGKRSEDFLRPFREGRVSFQELFSNPNTAPLIAETIAMFLKSEHLRNKEGKKPIEHSIISEGLTDSLAEIEEQLNGKNFDNIKDNSAQDQVKEYKINLFLALSDAVNASDPVIRKKINIWLLGHLNDIKKLTEYQNMPSDKDRDSVEQMLLNILYNAKSFAFIKRSGPNNLFSEIMKIVLNNNSEEGLHLDLESIEDDPRLMERILEIAICVVEKYGVDKSIIDKWDRSKYLGEDKEKGIIIKNSFLKNTQALEHLEKSMPGASKKLFEKFGIADFYRYDPKTLLRQLEMEDEDVPYGVVVFPEDDWSGAFASTKETMEKIRLQLNEGGYEIRIVEASSQFEMSKRLSHFNKKYAPSGQKIAFLILGGHGTGSTVQLGEKDLYNNVPPPLPGSVPDSEYPKYYRAWENQRRDRDTLTATDLEKGRGPGIRRAANKWFDNNAPVIFLSCSTGIEGGIAEKVSDELGFNTVGPDIPTSIDKINVYFDEQNKPRFKVKYHNGVNVNEYTSNKK